MRNSWEYPKDDYYDVIDNRPAAERIASKAATRRLAQMQKKREKDAKRKAKEGTK